MVSNNIMRKNIAKVLQAFKAGIAGYGDSKRTCWTNGNILYSYALPIACWVNPERTQAMCAHRNSTRTTNMQISACMVSLGDMIIGFTDNIRPYVNIMDIEPPIKTVAMDAILEGRASMETVINILSQTKRPIWSVTIVYETYQRMAELLK